MAKHSKFENERRAAETVRTKEKRSQSEALLVIAGTFTLAVATARARPPQGPFPNMPPGTRPNPPKREPRPTKEETNRRSSRS